MILYIVCFEVGYIKVSFCGGAALFQMLDLNEQVLLNVNLSIRVLHDFIVNLSSFDFL